MVQNSEWGPHLWTILHGCAERCGRQPTALLHVDEQRAWIQMLELVEAILPCPLCQKHYQTWKKAHPLKGFLQAKTGVEFQEAARHWVWALHDAVNEQRGVARPTLEDVKQPQDLQQALEELLKVLDRAKLQRLIDGVYVREWRQRLSLLRKFLRV